MYLMRRGSWNSRKSELFYGVLLQISGIRPIGLFEAHEILRLAIDDIHRPALCHICMNFIEWSPY